MNTSVQPNSRRSSIYINTFYLLEIYMCKEVGVSSRSPFTLFSLECMLGFRDGRPTSLPLQPAWIGHPAHSTTFPLGLTTWNERETMLIDDHQNENDWAIRPADGFDAAMCSECKMILPLKNFRRTLSRAQAKAWGYEGNHRYETHSKLCLQIGRAHV